MSFLRAVEEETHSPQAYSGMGNSKQTLHINLVTSDLFLSHKIELSVLKKKKKSYWFEYGNLDVGTRILCIFSDHFSMHISSWLRLHGLENTVFSHLTVPLSRASLHVTETLYQHIMIAMPYYLN